MSSIPSHRTTAELEAAAAYVASSPRDDGRVALLVARPAVDERRSLDAGTFTVDDGLVGDDWRTRGSARGAADPDRQVTFINRRFLETIAGGRDRWPLAGDQLVVDLDLSEDNLPVGTRLAIGSAVFEVTAAPHTGCAKFADRFGTEALRYANAPAGRRQRLRGMYARVVEPGTVTVGDAITCDRAGIRHHVAG